MSLRNFLQHFCNPMHVYCRLCDCRMSMPHARTLAGLWERGVYRRPGRALACLAALLLLVSCAVPAHAKHLHREHFYQQIWCDQHGGAVEVRLPGGLRIDCETATHAVEVDFAAKWAEAVGQSIAYAGATGHRPGILLILEKPSDIRFLRRLQQAIAMSCVDIDIWTITPEECPQ